MGLFSLLVSELCWSLLPSTCCHNHLLLLLCSRWLCQSSRRDSALLHVNNQPDFLLLKKSLSWHSSGTVWPRSSANGFISCLPESTLLWLGGHLSLPLCPPFPLFFSSFPAFLSYPFYHLCITSFPAQVSSCLVCLLAVRSYSFIPPCHPLSSPTCFSSTPLLSSSPLFTCSSVTTVMATVVTVIVLQLGQPVSREGEQGIPNNKPLLFPKGSHNTIGKGHQIHTCTWKNKYVHTQANAQTGTLYARCKLHIVCMMINMYD